jgi:hypothetical protein
MKDSLDQCLAAAFQDVLVPDGLAARLLDRLAAARQENELYHRPEVRRRLAIAAALAAVAAGLIVAACIGVRSGRQPISEQYALGEAIRMFQSDLPGVAHAIAETPAPERYRMSEAVHRFRGIKWRKLEDFLGCRGLVYEMPGPGGSHGALFVMEQQVDGLQAEPPIHPFTTGGCCAAIWQEGDMLYVLVVQGDAAAYASFLCLPRSPVVGIQRIPSRSA